MECGNLAVDRSIRIARPSQIYRAAVRWSRRRPQLMPLSSPVPASEHHRNQKGQLILETLGAEAQRTSLLPAQYGSSDSPSCLSNMAFLARLIELRV